MFIADFNGKIFNMGFGIMQKFISTFIFMMSGIFAGDDIRVTILQR